MVHEVRVEVYRLDESALEVLAEVLPCVYAVALQLLQAQNLRASQVEPLVAIVELYDHKWGLVIVDVQIYTGAERESLGK